MNGDGNVFRKKVIQLTNIGAFKRASSLDISANLLSRESVNRFGRFTKWISFIGAVPYVWNEKENKFERNQSRGGYALYILSKIYISLSMIYLVGRLIHENMYSELSLVDLTLHFMWAIIYFLITILNMNVICEERDILHFLNQFVSVINLFEGFHDPDKKYKRITRLEQILGTFPIMACFHIPALTSLFIYLPSAKVYVSSLVLTESYYNVYIHFLFACMELFSYLTNWGVLIFLLSFHYAALKHLDAWTRKLKKQMQTTQRGNTLVFYYRLMQCVMRYYNECSSMSLMVGHKIVVLVITVTSSYALAHFYNSLSIIVYMSYMVIFNASMIFQLISYPAASALFKASNPIHLIFLPRTPKYAHRRRFLKSCAPLRVWVGPFYFFRPFTPMKFFRIEFIYTMKIHFYLRQ